MKKINFKIIYLLFIMIFISVGCSQANPTPEPNDSQDEQKEPIQQAELKPADFFPLTQGSTWEYQGEGNEYASFLREVVFAEEDRAQVKENNGGTVSAAVFQVSETAVTRIYFQGEAYEDENFLDVSPGENTVILKTPLEVGTKWEDSSASKEIVETDAVVETPAGTFENCLKVKSTYEDSTIYEYFKVGVGMVKREFTSGETKVTSSLEKYSIKK